MWLISSDASSEQLRWTALGTCQINIYREMRHLVHTKAARLVFK